MKFQKNFRPDVRKRNFGLGHKPLFAARVALAHMFGCNDHFYTRHTHGARFSHFLNWLSNREQPIRDLRNIEMQHAIDYAATLAAAVVSGDMAVSYAQNLVSTVNIVMAAVRRDRTVWLSPSQAVGQRSHIRTVLPVATWDKVIEAVRLAENAGNFRGAALILLCRAFGMRLREAALANLHRLQREAEDYGAVWILEGTKGGYKSPDRRIPMESVQWQTLDYALHVVSDAGACLIDTNTSLREFVQQCVNPVRRLLRQADIRCLHDLRAERFIEVYERTSGQPAPIRQAGRFDRDADLIGRQAVSHQGGHQRLSVPSSYIGQRHRSNQEEPTE